MDDCHTFLLCPYRRWISPCVLYYLMIGLITSQIITGYRTQALTPGFWGEYGVNALGVDAILGNGCGIQGQSYTGITPGEWHGSRVSLQELDFVHIIFMLTALDVSQWCSGWHVGVSIQRSWVVSREGGYDFLFNADMVNLLWKKQ